MDTKSKMEIVLFLLHMIKKENILGTTKYEDGFLDNNIFIWMTKFLLYWISKSNL